MGRSIEKMGKIRKILLVIVVILVVLVIVFAAYVGKYYHADVDIDNYLQMDAVQTTVMGQDIGEGQYADGYWMDGSGTEDLVIFYPGAKVECTSYLPMFYELAASGVDVYIVDMPYNLAFFGMSAAEKVMEQTAGMYENYYLAGHSLGGAMGASFVAKHIQTSDALKGMIFLAAYPTKSLAKEDFSVLSIYGSEDTVLSMEKVEEGRQYMPTDYTEFCIEGGNHAQFGNYGVQEGDGTAQITAVEQQNQTVEQILNMINQ